MTYQQGEMMNSAKLSIVQKKGQVTIPVEIRKKMGLKEGDLVAFVETEQGIMISPQETIAMDTLDKLGEALKARGMTLEELMEEGDKTREELVREKYHLPKP